MTKVKFKDLALDATFSYNGLQYKKIKEKRISCCKFFNAVLVSDPKKQIGIKPLVEVEVETENNE
jgi:hypothetical protein